MLRAPARHHTAAWRTAGRSCAAACASSSPAKPCTTWAFQQRGHCRWSVQATRCCATCSTSAHPSPPNALKAYQSSYRQQLVCTLSSDMSDLSAAWIQQEMLPCAVAMQSMSLELWCAACRPPLCASGPSSCRPCAVGTSCRLYGHWQTTSSVICTHIWKVSSLSTRHTFLCMDTFSDHSSFIHAAVIAQLVSKM